MAKIDGRLARFAAGKKRGILFSLAILLLGTSLLTMAVLLSEQPGKASRTASTLMDIDRASYTYSYINDALALMISRSMNFSVENSTLKISASLPWDPRIAEDIGRFELFEENYSDSNVSLELSRVKNGSFVIMPGNVSVEQSNGSFRITPKEAGDVRAYYVALTLPNGTPVDFEWQAVSNSSGDLLPAYVVLMQLQDDGYLAWSRGTYKEIDRNGISILSINTSNVSQIGSIQIGPDAALRVDYAVNIGLKASVGFTNPVRVETEDTVDVRHAANQTGRVRVA